MAAGDADQQDRLHALPFSQFVAVRNAKHHPLIDKLISNNLSIFLAFGFYRARLTANMVTALRGVLSVIYFLTAMYLPSDDIAFSISVIFLFAYFIFALDCVDGQLARATETESRFGHFFDICIDMIANALVHGGIFFYTFEYFENLGDVYHMKMSIAVGIFFVVSGMVKFFVIHIYDSIYGDLLDRENSPGVVDDMIMSLFGMQSQIFGILLFWVSPTLAFAFFILQATVATASCLRYLWRAHRVG